MDTSTDDRRRGRHNGRRGKTGGRIISRISDAMVEMIPDPTTRDRAARAAFVAMTDALSSLDTTDAMVIDALALAQPATP